jgi:hypothetical protein
MVLKFYMDESGVHDDSPVVTVAAYAAAPRKWQEWTKRWNVAKRPIKVFHATDAQNLRGEFAGWTKQQRDDLVKRCLSVIAEADIAGIVIGIQMDEYRKALAGRDDLKMLVGAPYSACFQWVVQSVMFLQSRTTNRQRLVFVHESNDCQRETFDAFDFVKHQGNPQGSKIEFRFGDKVSHQPLQAADILAYEGNKRMRDPDRPERRPSKVLNPDRRILAAHYGKANMHELVSRLEKVANGRIDEIELDVGWRRYLT